MGIKFSNLGATTLATDLTSSATSISVVDGSVFPSLGSGDFFFATLDVFPNSTEIVKVTEISGNTLTVERGQDNTSAASHSAGDTVALRLVAAVLEDLRDASASPAQQLPVLSRTVDSTVTSVTNRGGSTLLTPESTVTAPFVLSRNQPIVTTQVLTRSGSVVMAASAFTAAVARTGSVTLQTSLNMFFTLVARNGYLAMDFAGTFFSVSGRQETHLIGL